MSEFTKTATEMPAEIQTLFDAATDHLKAHHDPAAPRFDTEGRMVMSEVQLGKGGTVRVHWTVWNEHVQMRRKAERAWKAHCKQVGRDYWAARGIRVGQKVYAFAANMLFGGMRVEGIAKVGANGAYVASSYQRGQLDPDSFSAA